MPLSEQEEFELLSLQRQRAMSSQAKPTDAAQKETPTNLGVFANSLVKGAAAVPDALLNTPNNMLNLAKMGAGTIAAAAGRPDLAPDVKENPNFARRALEAVRMIRPEMEPATTGQRAIDLLTQGAVGGALTGGGGLARTLTGAGMGTLSSAAAGATQAAGGGTEAQIIASLVTPNAVGAAANMAGRAARPLMQSALKPTWSDLNSGKADRAIDTMLREGVNPTYGGVNTLNRRIEDLSNRVAATLSSSSGTVDKNAVAARISDVIARIERTNPTPQDALRDAHRVYDQFIANGLIPASIPVTRAQELKQGIYQMLRDKYGQISSDTVEAQKALGRGFREGIEQVVPEVAALNARQGDLINARNVAERRALMEGNKNPVGLAMLAHSPLSALGMMANSSALAKSLAARGAYNLGNLDMANVAQNTSPIVTNNLLDLLRQAQQGQQ